MIVMSPKEAVKDPVRREVILSIPKLAALFGLPLHRLSPKKVEQKPNPIEIEASSWEVIAQVWKQERMGERLRKLEESYSAFGFTPTTVQKYSGTVNFFRQIEEWVALGPGPRPFPVPQISRRQFMRGHVTDEPNNQTLPNEVITNVVLPQFKPLQKRAIDGEDRVAKQYAAARNELCFSSKTNRQSAQRQVVGSDFHWSESIVAQDGRIQSAPFVDPTLGKAGCELLEALVSQLNSGIPGIACMVTSVDGFVPENGEKASVSQSRGTMNIATNVPLIQAVDPNLFLHEMGHLGPELLERIGPELLERTVGLSDLLFPARLAHWDPRLLLEGRTKINQLIAQLVEVARRPELQADEQEPGAATAMHIHFSDKVWIQECTGNSLLVPPKERSEHESFAREWNRLPERGVSPTMDVLREEIGEKDALVAQYHILANLQSDTKKMVGISDLLKKYPNSSVLQQWVARIARDIEHYILDVNTLYRVVASPSNLGISGQSSSAGDPNKMSDQPSSDPQGEAAFARMQISASLARPYGLPLPTNDEIVKLIESIGETYRTIFLQMLRASGVDSVQSSAIGDLFRAGEVNCVLTIAQILHNMTIYRSLSPFFESNHTEAMMLLDRLRELAPGIATSDVSRQIVTFQPVGEVQSTEELNATHRKATERLIVDGIQRLLEESFFVRPPSPNLFRIFKIIELVNKLEVTQLANTTVQAQLDLLRTLSTVVETMAIQAKRMQYQETEHELRNGSGMLVAVTYRIAAPFLLGWNFQTHSFDWKIIARLCGDLTHFQDTTQIYGINALPGMDVQNFLRTGFSDEFMKDLGIALEQTRVTIEQVALKPDDITPFVNKIKHVVDLLQSGCEAYIRSGRSVPEAVRTYFSSIASLNNTLDMLRNLPTESQLPACKLLFHRIEMAILGWVTTQPLDLNHARNSDYHDLYLGSSLDSVS